MLDISGQYQMQGFYSPTPFKFRSMKQLSDLIRKLNKIGGYYSMNVHIDKY